MLFLLNNTIHSVLTLFNNKFNVSLPLDFNWLRKLLIFRWLNELIFNTADYNRDAWVDTISLLSVDAEAFIKQNINAIISELDFESKPFNEVSLQIIISIHIVLL